jgi:DNA-binding transcriptional MocR family regulator
MSSRHRGVRVLPSSAFAVDDKEIEQGIRINVASTSSRDDLARSLKIIRGLHEHRPRILA